MKLALFFVLCSLLGLSVAQRSPVVKGNIPNDKEIDLLLSDQNTISRMVDCLIAFQFDDQNCDPRLKRAHELAEEFFRTSQQSCGNCSQYELQQVNKFLRELAKRHRSEHIRLTNGILERATSPEYDYY